MIVSTEVDLLNTKFALAPKLPSSLKYTCVLAPPAVGNVVTVPSAVLTARSSDGFKNIVPLPAGGVGTVLAAFCFRISMGNFPL